MKHHKFFCAVRQIAPDAASTLDGVSMLRTGLGYSGRGKHMAWVRVPFSRFCSGWRGKAGLAKLYYDSVIEVSKVPIIETNGEATTVLQQPDTELIGHQAFDPRQAAIVGSAWLCRDEGRLCPSLKLAQGHDFAGVREWVEQNLSTAFQLCSARDGLFVVQIASQEAANQDHFAWLLEIEDEERDSLHPSRLKPPNLTIMAVHAKLRWG
jgi:hypothetical protein